MTPAAPTFHYVPQTPIPAHLTGEVRAKLAYVDEAILAAAVAPEREGITLTLRTPLTAADEAALAAKVERVVAALVGGSLRLKENILEDYLDRPIPSCADPMAELVASGEIHPEAEGLYTLGPLLTRLIDYFEGRFLALAEHFDAAPYRFPTLIPAPYLERVNYFRAFPHSLSFATHLRADLEVIDHFASEAACLPDGTLNASTQAFAPIAALLSPAVCYHLYFALADKPLPGGKLAATAVGQCFRYEGFNLTSLERLWNFTMREVIFVGSKEWVLAQREAARAWMRPVLAEIGLAYRVESANDPFFIGEFRKQVAFQSAFQLKFEIRAALPFKDSTLAVGSYNYHQDFFGRHLNITLPDGSPAHTGCVAFGLERMALAFLAQWGLDPAAWPAAVRAGVA
jgi:hypothetical protein